MRTVCDIINIKIWVKTMRLARIAAGVNVVRKKVPRHRNMKEWELSERASAGSPFEGMRDTRRGFSGS